MELRLSHTLRNALRFEKFRDIFSMRNVLSYVSVCCIGKHCTCNCNITIILTMSLLYIEQKYSRMCLVKYFVIVFSFLNVIRNS